MSFQDQWRSEKAQKKQEREARQFARRMSAPIARGEVAQFGEAQLQNIASLALAIEALEDILVGSGVLEPDELLGTMESLARQKSDVVLAAKAAQGQSQV